MGFTFFSDIQHPISMGELVNIGQTYVRKVRAELQLEIIKLEALITLSENTEGSVIDPGLNTALQLQTKHVRDLSEHLAESTLFLSAIKSR
jgi:hypothetical protein